MVGQGERVIARRRRDDAALLLVIIEQQQRVAGPALLEAAGALEVIELAENLASGGERKRNELMQLSLLKPHLALLDEIDSGMDVDGVRAVVALVEKLRENGWNISRTAEIIGTPRSNLYKKLEQYGITQESDG